MAAAVLSFRTDRAALLATLSVVSKAIEARNTIPIWSHFLLRFSAEGLAVVGTDGDTQVTARVAGEVAGLFGQATLPASTLHGIVQKLPPGPVTIEIDPATNKAVVRAARSRFNLQSLDARDFPDFTAGDAPLSIEIAGNALAALIDKTGFAMSTEETRYYLNGLHMVAAPVEREEGPALALRVTATDGHRLARSECTAVTGLDGAIRPEGVIVPRKACTLLGRLAASCGDAGVRLGFTTYCVSISTDNVDIVSKLIEGQFPDCDRVIPYGNDLRMTTQTAPLVEAITRAATVAEGDGKPIKLTLGDGQLGIVARGEKGEGIEDLDVDYADTPTSIAFNSRYLGELVGKAGGQDVLVALGGQAGSPGLFRNPADEGSVFVLMPLRVAA